MSKNDRQFAPATVRNRQPILDVLKDILPTKVNILEAASGTGEHAVYFAKQQPQWIIQPSDPDVIHRKSIEAWRTHEKLSNVRSPLNLDATDRSTYPDTHYDAVLCINMVHISPKEATEGLMEMAYSALNPKGILYLYGPYKIDEKHTAPSNAAFDESLRAQNPDWGVRDMKWVIKKAADYGFSLAGKNPMPANNYSLWFKKT